MRGPTSTRLRPCSPRWSVDMADVGGRPGIGDTPGATGGMVMTAVVVCLSVSHGDTARVAGVIAEELGAAVLEPDTAVGQLGGCGDLLGVGSGIFGMAFPPRFGRFVAGSAGRPARRQGVDTVGPADDSLDENAAAVDRLIDAGRLSGTR
jgi:hypothetical protein